MIKGEGLGDLDEGLAQAGRITDLIRTLQSTLELFERGRKGEALEKISHLEEEVQNLEGSVLADAEKKRKNWIRFWNTWSGWKKTKIGQAVVVNLVRAVLFSRLI